MEDNNIVGAAWDEKFDEIKEMLDRGVDVNPRAGSPDTTALHQAAFKGNFQIVRMLLAHGADMDVFDWECGETALHMAAGRGHTDVVELLLDSGADVNTRNDLCKVNAPAEHVRPICAKISAFLDRDAPPLHCVPAAASLSRFPGNHASVVKWLHANQARDTLRTSPAIDLTAPNGHIEMLEWLVQHGYTAFTPYAMTTKSGARRWLARVLDARRPTIDPDLLDHELTKALRVAARLGHVEIVEYILSLPDVRVPVKGALEEAAVRGDTALIASLSPRRTNDACLASAAETAAKHGQLEVLQAIATTLGGVEFLSNSLDLHALQTGHLHVVEWLASQNWVFPSNLPIVAEIVASSGTLETIRWLHQHAPPEAMAQDNLVDFAARQENWEVLEYLVETVQRPLTSVAFACVAENGPLELTIKLWGLTASIVIETQAVLNVAAAGRLDVLGFLCDKNPAKSGELDVLEWVERNVSAEVIRPMTGLALVHAAQANKLELLQWIQGRGVNDWSPQVLQQAVMYNADLSLIQYLLTEHFNQVWAPAAMMKLAMCGRVDVFQWIHSEIKNLDGWDERLMDVAASSGHLETLQWLATHCSLRCSARGLSQAAMCDHWRVVAWLLEEQDVEVDAETLYYAASAGQVEIATRLLSRVQDLNQALNVSVSTGFAPTGQPDDQRSNLPMVQLLCGKGAKCTDVGSMANCAKNGQLETLQWLHAQKQLTDIPFDMLVQATRHGHSAMVRWMLRHAAPTQHPSRLHAQVVSVAAQLGEQDVLEVLVDRLGAACVTPQLLHSVSCFGPRHLGCTVAAWLYERIVDKNSRIVDKNSVNWQTIRASTCPAVQHWARQPLKFGECCTETDGPTAMGSWTVVLDQKD
ncbi:hypothetical protein P43SY_003691 [Pythium insidiosum]|uniref:Ankyrin repeat protein n=1 Tax=Pythium insidiosum TaxID=114742 RepID=A0AAD5Q9Z0_PYTIN|nr:hypothetical protein P43SY_003691 [Pythium insidiosum]